MARGERAATNAAADRSQTPRQDGKLITLSAEWSLGHEAEERSAPIWRCLEGLRERRD